ncbi:MAG: DUF5685 family protein [Eubacteriaceae bacterium]|nr:DUF5685 family protein [Eubacteriaceae bacterium]
MLGYVTTENAELKMKDYELYSGYYCGVCKSIGKRYGQVPRLVLSYDAAFLALLLAGVTDNENTVSREHCIIHHIKKKTVVRNDVVDYSGDVMLILAWHNIEDDANDEGKIYAKATLKAMKGLYKKLESKRNRLCEDIKEGLAELAECEKRKADSIDGPGSAFGKIMAAVMTGYEPASGSARALAGIGYHLGMWIYLMDAWDDLEKDIDSGSYNPLIYRFEYEDGESKDNFRKRIYDDVERNLMIYLAELSKSADLLDIRRNKDIIENIIYMGLLRRTEKALGKDENENGKSI